MEPILEPAPWLTGAHLGLRAPLLADADHAARWWPGDEADDPEAVRSALRARETIPWGKNPVITLVAIDLASGEICGGVQATRSSSGTCAVEVMAPEHDADVLREMLQLVVPWLAEEVGVRSVLLEAAADDAALLAAAGVAGMVEAVRRREHLVRPGGRVDLLQLERVNREWGRHAG